MCVCQFENLFLKKLETCREGHDRRERISHPFHFPLVPSSTHSISHPFHFPKFFYLIDQKFIDNLMKIITLLRSAPKFVAVINSYHQQVTSFTLKKIPCYREVTLIPLLKHKNNDFLPN